MGDWFIGGMVALQSCAAAAYLLEQEPKQALLWGAAALSNFAYLTLTRA
jgi:hypothetical protein